MRNIIVLAAFAVSFTSFGLPSYYVKNTNLNAVSNTPSRSTLIADSEDPNKVWVLPPHAGKVEYRGYTPSGGLGLCPALKDALKNISLIEKQMLKIQIKIGERENELDQLNREVVQKRKELARQIKNPHILEISQLELKVAALNRKIENLVNKMGDSDNPEEIKRLDKLLKQSQEQLLAVSEQLEELKIDNREAFIKYTIAKQEYDAAVETAHTHNRYLQDLLEDYDKNQDRVFARLDRYVKTTGAVASLDYDSQWTREMRFLQETHPNLNFVRMPTYNSRVSAKLVPKQNKDTYFQGLPLILHYNVNGKAHLPYGERFEKNDPGRRSSGLPEIVALDLTLNLVGGCPLVDPNYFDGLGIKLDRDANGVAKFGISTVYEYDVAFKFDVEAKYNLWSFYEKIVTKGTKGGLFSSKAYVDVLESTMAKDEFELIIRNEGEMTPKQIKEIKQEVRAELMNRVLTTIARPDPKNPPKIPSPGLPPEPGSTVIWIGSGKICGVNLYCRVGGWAFRIAGAIWGDKKTQTKVRQQWDTLVEERWDITTMAPRQAIVTYKR